MWGWHGLLVWKVVHAILKAMDYRHTGVQWEATAIVQDRDADGSDWVASSKIEMYLDYLRS